jgi:hypothetical protein
MYHEFIQQKKEEPFIASLFVLIPYSLFVINVSQITTAEGSREANP